MKEITPKKMKEIDLAASRVFGIPSLILMENAGRGLAEVAAGMLSGKEKRVVCVCGKGNNGGDGFVCARHLVNKGLEVSVFLIGESEQLKGDAQLNFSILEKMEVSVEKIITKDDLKKLEGFLKKTDLVIDAIFGIGVSGSVKDPYCQIIKAINASKKKVLAVDLPSGLDATEGFLLGSCIKADITVTFVAPKTGLVKNQGPEFCGEVIIVDISAPKQLLA